MYRSTRASLVVSLIAAFGLATPEASNHDLRLPAPVYPDVVQLRDAGRPLDALAELDRAVADRDPSRQPLEAVLLRASVLEALGLADANPLWQAIADRSTALRGHALRSLVRSLSQRDDAGAAETALNDLIAHAGLAANLDLVVAVADARRRRDEHPQAAALYWRVLTAQQRGPDADRARLGLAATLEATGDMTGAIALLRDAQLQHRSAAIYAAARQTEDRLLSAADRRRAPWSDREYRALVQRLRDEARYDLTRRLLDEWRDAYPSTAGRDIIDAELVTTLYTMRANDDAIAACDRFVRSFPQSPRLGDVLLTRFRLDVRLGRTADARERGLALVSGRVAGASAAERQGAGVLLAAYLVSIGDVEGGLDLYRQLFRQATSADDQRDFLWKTGVAALRVGQIDRALTNLRALMARGPRGDLEPAGLYWLGVAAAAAGQTAEAERAFRDLETRYRYHYYGVRAAERLDAVAGAGRRRPTPASPIAFPAVRLAEAVRQHPRFVAASIFAQAGLRVEAAGEIGRLLRSRGSDAALALVTARAAAEAGDYRTVSALMATHFGSFLERPATGLPDDFWRLVYPRPFWDEIRAAAETNRLDPVWMLALMRQESRFDPYARSAVGAVGLFQIMPYTARTVADGIDGLDDGDSLNEAKLMEPAVNASIAARVARTLIDMFDHALEPVAASYNAGEDRAAVWWKHASEAGEDMFVDLIPYTETRRFVREVLENYWSYKRIYEN